MTVIDFSAYRAFRPREGNDQRPHEVAREQADSRVTISFSGDPDDVIRATLEWIDALDEQDENFGMWSDPVMVVEKGLISFVGYDEGDTGWRKLLSEERRAWQFKEAEIFEIRVLAEIILDHQADLYSLLAEGISEESWTNEFLLVMDNDKYDYNVRR